jgi:hypothetical protein
MQPAMKRWRRHAMVAAAVAAFVAGVVWLPTIAALAFGMVLALLGVGLFRENSWRTGSLTVAALMFGLTGVQLVLEITAPKPAGAGVVKTHTPSEWIPYNKILGYRPRPNTEVLAVASMGDETIFRAVYSIDASGARVSPGSAREGPTYLFMGDSFVFGEGLSDADTLPSQFARAIDSKARIVNLGVVGYGPNHMVRALETGLYDSYAPAGAAAVVTWIIPQQLPRVTGDGNWLGDSPRYVLDAGRVPRFTGTFFEHRLFNPLAGALYLAGKNFKAVARALSASEEREQAELFVALFARLKQLAQERFGAPLVVVQLWPDKVEKGDANAVYVPILLAIRDLGVRTISVDKIIGDGDRSPYYIPRDGHPNARLNGLIAQVLKAELAP